MSASTRLLPLYHTVRLLSSTFLCRFSHFAPHTSTSFLWFLRAVVAQVSGELWRYAGLTVGNSKLRQLMQRLLCQRMLWSLGFPMYLVGLLEERFCFQVFPFGNAQPGQIGQKRSRFGMLWPQALLMYLQGFQQ